MSIVDDVKGKLKRTSGFSLENVTDFPTTEYTSNLTKYETLESWFSGAILDTQLAVAQSKVDKYPIRINPVYGAVLKHAYVLFGEFDDDQGGPLVAPKIKLRDGGTDEETERIEDMLKIMWAENNGASQMMEAGISSQIFGGCVFRIAWSPYDEVNLTTKLRIEHVPPFEFVGFPMAGNPWMLSEAWVIRKISAKTAQDYGVNLNSSEGYYIERWRPNEYEVKINDSPIGYTVGNNTFKLGMRNPFGFVPFVYIPHVRYKGFYGDSLITSSVQGITKEINSRLADSGDAVSDDTHAFAIMRNVRGKPPIEELIPGLKVVNLGSKQAVVGGEGEPDLVFPAKPRTSEAILKLNDLLYKYLRREINIPAVADGEDEGSQRSSLTLTTRMWPLVSHCKHERANWTTGLRILHRMALQMLYVKQENHDWNVTEDHLKYRISSRWAPILPRDRENLINELAIRAAHNLGSLEHLLELTGDVENIPDEMKMIRAFLEFTANLGPEPAEEESPSTNKAGDGQAKKEKNAAKD